MELEDENYEDDSVVITLSNGAGFSSVRPVRRLDTRANSMPSSGDTVCVQVAGRDGIPSTAQAVAINLTAVTPTGNGFLVAYPKGSSRPNTSSVNYAAGKNTANGTLVKVGSNASICVYVQTAAHVIVDVTGYFGSDTAFSPVAPYRRHDTRDNSRPGAGATKCIQIAGKNGIHTSATAVAINLTAVSPGANGYLAAYPKGSSRPATSTVNYTADQNTANSALVQVGDDGSICVYNHTATDFIVDVSGYFGIASDYSSLRPYRKLDTRSGGIPGSGTVRCVQVAGKNGVPNTAKAVAVNLTAVGPAANGFMVAFPEGTTRPQTSTLNYTAGQTTANNAIVQVGNEGYICVYVHTAVDIIIDVSGFWNGDSTTAFKTWGWDYNLNHRCVQSPFPGQENSFADASDCPTAGRNWAVAVQAEKTLQNGCVGPASQSLPINAGGALNLFWAPHQDEMGRSNWSVALKTDWQNNTHPCGGGTYTWYAFMDHRHHGGGPFPSPADAVFHGTVWYDDWATNGGSRVIAGWSGEWDGKGVLLEIDLQSTNWDDGFPNVPDIIQAIDHANFQWVQMDGKAMGLTVPRRQETSITIHWHEIIRDLIARKYLKGPSGKLKDGQTSGMSIATEVRNDTATNAASAELRVSNFRVLSR